MKEIFISYSTADVENAEAVRDTLENNGLSCWMAPRDIPGGSNYTREIPIAIRNCTVFVLILSQNAQNSHWVLKELDSAVNAGKVILPFMLENFDLSDEFQFLLTGTQWYTAYQQKDHALEALMRRIRSILDAPESTPSREQTPVTKASSDAACPACGSTDLTICPRRIKRRGAELLSLLLIPAFAALGICTGMFFYSLLLFYSPVDLLGWTILAFTILFGLLGIYLSRTIVLRRRLRKRIHCVSYRCNRCRKLFLREKPLDR